MLLTAEHGRQRPVAPRYGLRREQTLNHCIWRCAALSVVLGELAGDARTCAHVAWRVLWSLTMFLTMLLVIITANPRTHSDG